MGADLNEKVFQQIVLIQAVAMRALDQGFPERLRFRMKNEVKILYRFVMTNMELLRGF